MDDDGTLCGVHPFDINNLRLVSQFNEKGPDSFFVFLDCVSKVPADEFVLLYKRDSCDCELLQGEASAGVHPALPGCMVFALFWAVVWLVVGFGLMFLLYQL